MAVELISGLSIFKSAFDIAKGLKDINDAATRNAAVIELQEKILGAQAAQSALIERVREAEAEVARLKAWEREKDRYRLVRWEYGAFAYIPKDAEAGGEPPHALCATCYQRSVKSLLQFNGEMQIFKQAWDCPSCKFSLKAGRDALSDFT